MTWRPTADAERDLEQITIFGARRYGLGSALDYYDELVTVFDRLAEYPGLNPERIVKGRRVHLHPHIAHHIIYSVEAGDVLILRVLHGSANWIDHL